MKWYYFVPVLFVIGGMSYYHDFNIEQCAPALALGAGTHFIWDILLYPVLLWLGWKGKAALMCHQNHKTECCENPKHV